MLIYLAHPVSGDVPGNLARAKRWLKWACLSFPDDEVIAPWITECEIFDDADPEQREQGLQRCERVVERCHVLILVGGRISSGMQREADAARAARYRTRVIDLTHLGDEPPEVRNYRFWLESSDA